MIFATPCSIFQTQCNQRQQKMKKIITQDVTVIKCELITFYPLKTKCTKIRLVSQRILLLVQWPHTLKCLQKKIKNWRMKMYDSVPIPLFMSHTKFVSSLILTHSSSYHPLYHLVTRPCSSLNLVNDSSFLRAGPAFGGHVQFPQFN